MNEKAKAMIEKQLKPRGISDRRVLRAMGKVSRESFVPAEEKAYAYDDSPLSIGEGQTISQPYMVAVMTELLRLTGTEKLLEIGTGSGYQTAVAAELCGEVFTVERLPDLSLRAQQVLQRLGYRNIRFRTSDGSGGWPEHAPFDRILVTAASDGIPAPLFQQLSEGGILLLPVGERFGQVLTRVFKRGGKMEIERLEAVVFVPLIGKYARRE